MTRIAQEPCKSRGSHHRLPVRNSPYGFCGRKATLDLNNEVYTARKRRSRVLCLTIIIRSVLFNLISVELLRGRAKRFEPQSHSGPGLHFEEPQQAPLAQAALVSGSRGRPADKCQSNKHGA